jgi:hypothetical protein
MLSFLHLCPSVSTNGEGQTFCFLSYIFILFCQHASDFARAGGVFQLIFFLLCHQFAGWKHEPVISKKTNTNFDEMTCLRGRNNSKTWIGEVGILEMLTENRDLFHPLTP